MATGKQKASSNNNYTEMTVKKGLIEGDRTEFSYDGKVDQRAHFDDGVLDGKREVHDMFSDSMEVWDDGHLKSADITVHGPDGVVSVTAKVECIDVCGSQNESNRPQVHMDYDKAAITMVEIITKGQEPRGMSGMKSGFKALDYAGREFAYRATGSYRWTLENPGIAKVLTTFRNGAPDGVQSVVDSTGAEVLRADWRDGQLQSMSGVLWPTGAPVAATSQTQVPPEPATAPQAPTSVSAPQASTQSAGTTGASAFPPPTGHETRAGNPDASSIVIFQYDGTDGPKPAFCADEGIDGVMCRSDSSTEIGVGTWRDFAIKGSKTCIAGTPGCVVPKVYETLKPKG